MQSIYSKLNSNRYVDSRYYAESASKRRSSKMSLSLSSRRKINLSSGSKVLFFSISRGYFNKTREKVKLGKNEE